MRTVRVFNARSCGGAWSSGTDATEDRLALEELELELAACRASIADHEALVLDAPAAATLHADLLAMERIEARMARAERELDVLDTHELREDMQRMERA